MKVAAWGLTDVGLKRSINQDTILVDPVANLYIVADGMGGHKGGEVASALAVETVKNILAQERESESFSPRDMISRAYHEASSRIHHQSSVENPELAGMGTTMVLTYFHDDTLYIGNVGDSRAYLFFENQLWQMTEDHSLVNEQVRAGVIKEEDMDTVSGKNVITRSVGFEKEVNVDIFERKMKPGDCVLICSDGLCGFVNDEAIEQICKNYEGEKIVKTCVNEALKTGGEDNISVIFLQMLE